MSRTTPLLEEAVRVAVKEHAELYRDGQEPLPYATHALEVMTLLRYLGGVTDEHLLCAAALHDTVEQSGASIKKIERKFGKRIASLVAELTRPAHSGTSQQRFAALLDEVRKMSPGAKAIKLADRLSNVRADCATKSPRKRGEYLQRTGLLLAEIPREINPPLWDAVQSAVASTEPCP